MGIVHGSPPAPFYNDDTRSAGSTVWLDLRPGVPADARYKMAVVCEVSCAHYTIKYSGDGVRWRTVLNETGPTSDRATVFYNPFRKKWVYSIKTGLASRHGAPPPPRRAKGEAKRPPPLG
jgi:hypothetical protein